MPLGEKIKKFIEERGIKQTFLAEKTGLSNSIISKILNDNHSITADTYYAICKALRVDLNYFFEDEE